MLIAKQLLNKEKNYGHGGIRYIDPPSYVYYIYYLHNTSVIKTKM